MACKLTSNITKENCEYQIAGIKSIYLINFGSVKEYTQAADKKSYSAIELNEGEEAYKIEFIDNTASWTDDLAVNGNGGKYRTHTLNFTLSEYDYTVLNESKKLSLGKFTAVVVDKSGKTVVLGRLNGLSATSFNYASGAAEADANGWTTVFAGTEMEVGQLLSGEQVISTLVHKDAPVNIVP